MSLWREDYGISLPFQAFVLMTVLDLDVVLLLLVSFIKNDSLILVLSKSNVSNRTFHLSPLVLEKVLK